MSEGAVFLTVATVLVGVGVGGTLAYQHWTRTLTPAEVQQRQEAAAEERKRVDAWRTPQRVAEAPDGTVLWSVSPPNDRTIYFATSGTAQTLTHRCGKSTCSDLQVVPTAPATP